MSQHKTHRIVPALFCIAAALAMAAAGVLLFDSRDELLSAESDGDTSFVSYAQEVSDDEPEEPEPTDSQQTPSIDYDQLASEGWEVLQPLPDEADSTFEEPTSPDIGQSDSRTPPGRGNATLIVITNFSRAQVTINGEEYPAYSDDGKNRGMRVQSGEQHEVHVEFGESSKIYRINLQPGERRLLMVELTGMNASSTPPRRPRASTQREEPDEEEEVGDDEGRITVYSRPRGDIFVGETDMNQNTPGTVDVDPGRHEVQVRYDDGEMSETKTVRVREGSRIKLFFRQSE